MSAESLKHRVVDKITSPFQRMFMDSLPVIDEATRYEIAPDFVECTQAAAREGLQPIIISSHFQHYDLKPMSVVAEITLATMNTVLPPEKKFRGFTATIAKSAETGAQGPAIKRALDQIRPELSSRGLDLFGTVRPVDVERYGMTPNSIETANMIRRSVQEKRGLAFFPEGSVEGGRRKKGSRNGETNGMQPMRDFSFSQIMELSTFQGTENFFIFMTPYKTNRIVDPTNNLPTAEALAAILDGECRDIASITVGSIVKTQDVLDVLDIDLSEKNKREKIHDLRKNASFIDEYMMRRLALTAPKEVRGVWSDTPDSIVELNDYMRDKIAA